MAWQPESILICRDDHIVTLPSPSGSAPMRFTYTDIPHAYTNHASPIQSTPHASVSPNHGVLHTVLHPTMGSFTQGQHSWGSLTQFYGHASNDLTTSHPTSDTIWSEERAWSPHPDLNPGLQSAKHAL